MVTEIASFIGFIILILTIVVGIYVYSSLALMTIAKKTDTENAWLAWIPFANTYLISQIAQTPWWTFIVFIALILIPIVGGIAATAFTIYWWWGIAEERGFTGWFGVLMIIPFVNLVVLGILAWSD